MAGARLVFSGRRPRVSASSTSAAGVPGNRRGERAVEAQLALEFAVAQVHVRRGGTRCAFAGIEEAVAGRRAGFAQEEEAAAAEARAVGFDHGQGGADRDAGVEGIAAGLEDLPADVAGQRVSGGDGAVLQRVGLDGAGQQQQEGDGGLEALAQPREASGLPPVDHQALPVMIRYLRISSSLLSTLFSSSGMQSTGHTCWHCGSS
ncbi:hypothetical protein BAY1663_04959 [Pseudomonas sp. BAY1663]|nr:hypothetical protein BAY1663_04959 [Pseudomonas sp. BAY1663]